MTKIKIGDDTFERRSPGGVVFYTVFIEVTVSDGTTYRIDEDLHMEFGPERSHFDKAYFHSLLRENNVDPDDVVEINEVTVTEKRNFISYTDAMED